MVYISLIRGINVGGHKLMKMEALRALYASLDLSGAQTLLQSGNVVFSTDDADRQGLIRRIGEGIEQSFGFSADVILRTAGEWNDMMARNPFQRQAKDEPGRMLVMCLRKAPTKDAKVGLMEAHKGPEKLAFSGRELYLFYPDGIGRSKLTNVLIERHLQLPGTARNWNTVKKLAAMAEGSGGS